MFKTILVAVDLNEMAGAERLAAAARLLASGGGAIHVINVLPPMGMPMVGAAFEPEHERKAQAEAQATLRDWVSKALPEGTQAHVATGTIYDIVLREAKQIGADAIIVGAHRPELKDYLVGPNAARIMRHANQSVMVVR